MTKKEKRSADAPCHYSAEGADGWADGYNAAMRDIAARPAQPTREEIAKALALTFHGDLGEWQGFLSKADAFTSALSGDVSKPSYCALCDLEHQLHEDAQGFHHVIKGERVACSSALHEGEK